MPDVLKARKWWQWALGILVLLTLIGALIPAEDKDDDTASTSVTQAATATTPTATTTADTTPAEPVDTGRMSGSEYDELKRVSLAFIDEAQTFTDGIAGKCSTLLQAGELADGSDCFKDAFDGVEDKARVAYSVYTDQKGSTAKECKAALSKLRAGLERYTNSMTVLADLGENLSEDTGLVAAAVEQLKARRTSFDTRRGNAFERCAPA